MLQNSSFVSRTQKRILAKWKKRGTAIKKVRQLLRFGRRSNQCILFIVGCQRSGTNMLADILAQDVNTCVYHESHPKVVYPKGDKALRLKPSPQVREVLSNQRGPIAVIKPLVETQNITKLLAEFDGAKAVWIYRNFRDVASSNLINFGINNGIRNLRPITVDDPDNWRSERVSPEMRSLVCRFFSEEMKPLDAAALFWLVRNSLFFDLKLDQRQDLLIVKYEDLVTDPSDNMRRIYQFIEYDYPGDSIVKNVKITSVGKGSSAEISPEIEELCEELLHRIDLCYMTQRGLQP